MLCPTCKTVNLAMTDRQGIEIDYCPQCRGIWLDRGELDRLIERAEQASVPAMPERSHQHKDDYRKKRPKSLLGELFDF
ncbi:MAG: zf-TFIIB domain-containing protein [Pseudomonadota bacterium]|nr:zf-TFIIB domain-containing protein [Pseudomonadota bacterium]